MTPVWLSMSANAITVCLSAVALISICRMVTMMDAESGYLAWFGSGLIVTGGCITTVNRWIVAEQWGEPLLKVDLFSFLAAGFVCLGYAIWSGQQVLQYRARPTVVWLVPAVLIGAIQVLGLVLATLPILQNQLLLQLFITTLAAFVVAWLCIRQALWERLQRVVICAAVYLGVVITLTALPSLSSTTSPAMPWIVQGLNILASLVFVLIGFNLKQATQRRIELRQRIARLEG